MKKKIKKRAGELANFILRLFRISVKRKHSHIMDTINQVAKTCHYVNKAYCESIGDFSQPNWDNIPDHAGDIAWAWSYMVHPDLTPKQIHANWMATKEAHGWKYGPVKNMETKEHPSMVPYDQLPKEEQVKDALILAVVDSFDRDKPQF